MATILPRDIIIHYLVLNQFNIKLFYLQIIMSSYFYPYNYLNYNTLNRPSTFTNTCFEPNCPQPQPYTSKLNTPEQDGFVKMLTDRYNLGLQRLMDSRQPSRFDNLNNLPVYNTNMGPLPSNYMHYNSKINM